MNWTGGRLSNASQQNGVSLRSSSNSTVNLASNERTFAIARRKRIQKQHFQRNARIRRAYRPRDDHLNEASYTSKAGTPQLIPPSSIEYSINQTPQTDASIESNKNNDAENTSNHDSTTGDEDLSILYVSPEKVVEMDEKRRSLLAQDDWAALALADPKRKRNTPNKEESGKEIPDFFRQVPSLTTSEIKTKSYSTSDASMPSSPIKPINMFKRNLISNCQPLVEDVNEYPTMFADKSDGVSIIQEEVEFFGNGKSDENEMYKDVSLPNVESSFTIYMDKQAGKGISSQFSNVSPKSAKNAESKSSLKSNRSKDWEELVHDDSSS
ncbi:hypothetical protein V1514DRAFT_329555 [Lipomyces japonicus]|uniref:uncharacterized protein n=1 Tax=Lipomyces japonicus TaxID=56871 RepID=UPI0034CE355F